MFEKIAKWVDSIPLWFLALITAALLTITLLITVYPPKAEASPPMVKCTCAQAQYKRYTKEAIVAWVASLGLKQHVEVPE